MSNIRIIFLGGQDERFKNMVAVEIDRDIFVVETGCSLPDKNKHGIDYIIPKYDYLVSNKDRVRAYLITEGNDCILGTLPFIYDKVPAPIVCTDVTRIFLFTFCEHNNINPSHYDFKIVEPSDDITINGHLIRLFSTCSNMANSFGICFDTDQGNIIFALDYVFDNNMTKSFVTDIKKMGVIADKETLVLLLDSMNSERAGYSSPMYKLRNIVREPLKNVAGRIIAAAESPDVYNITDIIRICSVAHKKIVLYDTATSDLVYRLIRAGVISVPKDTFIPAEDINRYPATEIVVLITGFKNRLLHKVSLLARGLHDNKIISLNETDTFVLGTHFSNDVEIDYFDAMDDLYRANVNVVTIRKNEFVKMHPSQDDIKTMLTIFRPKYYVPISGYLVSLLANANIAVNMGIGLNHQNVLLVDNGMILNCTNGTCTYSSEKVLAGDVMVDGKDVSNFTEQLIEERRQISDDGVVVLGAAISLSKKEILGGIDVQTRGLFYAKNSEAMIRDMQTLFTKVVSNHLKDETFEKQAVEDEVKNMVLNLIRRSTLKTPLIIVALEEVE
ncbi:MAG: ribonuclease J [Bacilli bacterium]|nr:ribonuclease J [Bacilli bacterium]MBR0194088.1 ribonuclease J [Bacilli bacterium]